MIRNKDSPSRAVALDLMLRTFMNSSEFNDLQNKNWEAIAKLIPGSTPQECAKRFQELQSAAGDLPPVGNVSSLAARGKMVAASRGRTNSHSERIARALSTSCGGLDEDEDSDGSGKLESSSINGKTDDKDADEADHVQEQQKDVGNQQPTSESPSVTPRKGGNYNPAEPHGPNMVIHVCDEAKNVKRDFQCPRDLLVAEMRYFSEYLSTDAQRWEEVDISVHCDVQIFNWLMKYVKRNSMETMGMVMPKLEPTNVISILISSDFLKMDSLVTECIRFAHKNMSAIVATPCNMNCINDRLCTRIADLFTDVEADEVKDRKDKYKSKLFCKKIEKLFEPGGPASTLYRCSFCKRYLTKKVESKLKCLPRRMSIDDKGNISYHHHRDGHWDVNDFVLSLRNELKSWRDVYWRLWGNVNHLTCSRCKQVLSCSELGHCSYHPEPAKFNNSLETHMSSAIGVYGCCNQQTLRFDPLEQNSGCQVKDHIVTLSSTNQEGDQQPLTNKQQHQGNDAKVLDILLQRREIICVPPKSPEPEKWTDINLFSGEEALCGVIEEGIGVKGHMYCIFPDDNLPFEKQDHDSVYTDPITPDHQDEIDNTTDDEVGDDEPPKGRSRYHIPRKTSSKGLGPKRSVSGESGPGGLGNGRKKWDSQRSIRWNQDAQREEDRKRNQRMIVHLTKKRCSKLEKAMEKNKNKEYAGGIFSRLEAQFRSSLQVNKPPPSGTMPRTKTRTGQLRTT